MGTGSVQRETDSQSQSVFKPLHRGGKVVVYPYMGEIVLLPFTGSLMHQWSQLTLQFFEKLVGLDVYIDYSAVPTSVCIACLLQSGSTKSTAFPAAEGTCAFVAGADWGTKGQWIMGKCSLLSLK